MEAGLETCEFKRWSIASEVLCLNLGEAATGGTFVRVFEQSDYSQSVDSCTVGILLFSSFLLKTHTYNS